MYRKRRPAASPPAPAAKSRRPPLALSEEERSLALAALHSPRFVDAAPRQVYASLLDEGVYLGSERTLYRLLAQQGESRERRDQLRHPAYTKPELMADAPNRVWSWDITKLKGPTKWCHYQLYIVIDIFSRYVVAWMLAECEAASLAQRLIAEAIQRFEVAPGQLTVHADRGPSMTSKPVALMLADLGVLKSHNRPYTSNDNPFSESQIKTLKYHPAFPDRFGSLQDARAFCSTFFDWYNHEHRHSGIALMVPADVHFGRTETILERRNRTLHMAFQQNPLRFKHKIPYAKTPPSKVWINPPDDPEGDSSLDESQNVSQNH